MIRGGNKSLLYCHLRLCLEDMEAEYGDLLLYKQLRWPSAWKWLEQFFVIRKEILAVPNQFVSSDTTQLVGESRDFLKQLAFLTNTANHFNELDLKLQRRNHLVSDLMKKGNGFHNKFKIFFKKEVISPFLKLSTTSRKF